MSDIRANTISDAAGTGPIDLYKQSAAKAWVNFNQTVPQIEDSQNVASVTDSGAGDSIINFTNNMSAATFGATCGAVTYNVAINTITVSGSRVLTYSGGGTLTDYAFVGYTAHGDLA